MQRRAARDPYRVSLTKTINLVLTYRFDIPHAADRKAAQRRRVSMSDVLGFVSDSNTTTTLVAIVAAALSFVIALLVVLSDQPLLDPSFESDPKSSARQKC